MDNWMLLSEKEPEAFVTVLFFEPQFISCENKGVFAGLWNGVVFRPIQSMVPQGVKIIFSKATHWMPLPKPPQTDGKEATDGKG